MSDPDTHSNPEPTRKGDVHVMLSPQVAIEQVRMSGSGGSGHARLADGEDSPAGQPNQKVRVNSGQRPSNLPGVTRFLGQIPKRRGCLYC